MEGYGNPRWLFNRKPTEKVLALNLERITNIPCESILDKSEIDEIHIHKFPNFPNDPIDLRIGELEAHAKEFRSYFESKSMHASLTLKRDSKLANDDLKVALILAYGYNRLTSLALRTDQPEFALDLITEAIYFTGHAESIYLELKRQRNAEKHLQDRSEAGKKKIDKYSGLKNEVAKLLIIKSANNPWRSQLQAINAIRDEICEFNASHGNLLKEDNLDRTLQDWLSPNTLLRSVFDATSATDIKKATE